MSYKVNVKDRDLHITMDQLSALNIISTGVSTYHAIHKNQSYNVELVKIDLNAKTLHLRINNNDYHVKIQDHNDQLIDKMGLSSVGHSAIQDVKAPMPGLILEVFVDPGQSVQKGDHLLVLEAMKMENVLKANADGVIKSINSAKGATVDKGQVIIEME